VGTKRRTSVNSTVSLPPGARTHSVDSSASAYTAAAIAQQSPFASSPNVAAMAGMDRVASGTSQQEKKKTPRKPVPAYVSPPPTAISNDPSISSPTFTPPQPFIDTETQVLKRFSGHYGVSSRAAGSDPQLNHKSSFGPGGVEGKPLHYLIPDMPAAAS